MWELDCEEGWALKNWCFWTVVLEKTLESPLDCKEIQPVHPKGDRSWVFTGRTDVEVEALVLWPPGVKNWLTGKDPDVGKNWRWEEKGTTEDEAVGQHRWCNEHEFERAAGIGVDREACCAAARGVAKSRTRLSNWTDWLRVVKVPSWCRLCQDFLPFKVAYYAIVQSVCSVAQSPLTLCDSMDCSLPGSPLHGISLARMLEQVAISLPQGFSRPRDWTHVSCTGRRILYHWSPRKPLLLYIHTAFYLSIYPLRVTWVSSTFWLVWLMLSMNTCIRMSLCDLAFNSFKKVEKLDHIVILFLIFWETATLFSIVTAPLCIATNSTLGLQFLHSLNTFSYICIHTHTHTHTHIYIYMHIYI